MSGKIDIKELERLFKKISYHRAAEGPQYFKELSEERKTLADIRALLSGHTEEEIRSAFHEANGMRYLVMEYEFVSSSDAGVS